MNKRQRMDPSARRAALLEAAELAFARHGVDGTRIEDVAAEAGVASGLLYRYFPSKDALLEALMTHRAGLFEQRMRVALDRLDAEHAPPGRLVAEGLQIWLAQVVTDVMEGRWVSRAEPIACSAFRTKTRDLVTTRILEIAPQVDPGTAAIVTAILEAVAESAVQAWEQGNRPVGTDVLQAVVTAFCIGGLDSLARLLGVDIDLEAPETVVASGAPSRRRP